MKDHLSEKENHIIIMALHLYYDYLLNEGDTEDMIPLIEEKYLIINKLERLNNQ